MTILLLCDKLGISAGYESAWSSMLMSAGLLSQSIVRASAWHSPVAKAHKLLIQKGNRKSPGFNPDEVVQDLLRSWLTQQVKIHKADFILCMDVAMLGVVESSWQIATIDALRGGTYKFAGIPFLVTLPITAIHSQKKLKDIRAMNEGAESVEEWDEDEHEEGEFFVEPYTIPYGRWVIAADLRKASRLLQRT